MHLLFLCFWCSINHVQLIQITVNYLKLQNVSQALRLMDTKVQQADFTLLHDEMVLCVMHVMISNYYNLVCKHTEYPISQLSSTCLNKREIGRL